MKETVGSDAKAFEAGEGRDAVVVVEVSIIEQLALMLRCSIGTLGGGWSATARCAQNLVVLRKRW